ncbi:Peroxin 13, N-terminal region-domain-containing protein [Pilobolus umbonatus]|nr:Peroxin 13, N-terminal region-domain-containing protein [Pilobolus umbonatus]
MPSPPKPWEINSASSPVVNQTQTTNMSLPSIPDRPSTMASTVVGYGGYGSSGYGGGYGSSGYGGFGSSSYGGYNSTGYGGYGSSSYGGYNSTGYGGYGSYGSNRFGGGYNRFGAGGPGGMYGPDGGPEDYSLTQRMESGTRATFMVIQAIVGAFGGFAQMLDSTYMATHSSFMAMVGVAEQFGNLKHYLGNIFNIFALFRWIRRLLYRLVGRTPPPELVDKPEDEPLQITQQGEEQPAITDDGK